MKSRLDKALVDMGLVKSRERARELIEAGQVLVRGIPVGKPGSLVPEGVSVSLKGSDMPYVGRGGLKLEGAARELRVSFEGRTAMDVGASTGGFTDYMLRHGASRVYAVDVGYGQLDYGLRMDPRVVVIERMNIRHMPEGVVPERVDIAVVDVSFISLLKVAPRIVGLLAPGRGELLALVKPQFEAGRADVGKGGIVRDEGVRERVLEGVREGLEALGLFHISHCLSPITGQKGNVEYFIYMRKGEFHD